MLREIVSFPEPISTINVTTFASVVSVVFLILFTFEVVVVPDLGHHGPAVDLPKASFAVNLPRADRDDAINIVIMRDGKIFFGNDRANIEELRGKIIEQLSRRAERKAYIRADARTRYGMVKAVLSAVRSTGVQEIGFLVDERKPLK